LAVGSGFIVKENVRDEEWCSHWDEEDIYYVKKFYGDTNPTTSSETKTESKTDQDPVIPPGNVALTTWVFFLAIGTIFFFGCACAWCIAGIIGCCGANRSVDIEYKLIQDDDSEKSS